MNRQGLVAHVEAYLGEMAGGFGDIAGHDPIQVAVFVDQPFKGVVTYVTLGMSNSVLKMPRNRSVRMELVFAADKSCPGDEIASFLRSFAHSIIARGEAILRGQVIGPSSPIIPEYSLNSVYVSTPNVYPKGFATYTGTEPPVVFAWLIPVYESEARYITINGWSKFEDILEEKDPDLWSLERQPVV